MNRQAYRVHGGQSASDYATLLAAVAPLATTFGSIVRSTSIHLDEKAISVLRSLEPAMISAAEVAKWPGTELIGGRRSVRYLYHLQPASLEIIKSSASSLFEWVNPELPEDLHFIRRDGTTVLGTVAQEDDAWLELDDGEVAKMLELKIGWISEMLGRAG